MVLQVRTLTKDLTAAPRCLRPAAARARPAQISSLLLASLVLVLLDGS
jgi:hypothetical protein